AAQCRRLNQERGALRQALVVAQQWTNEEKELISKREAKKKKSGKSKGDEVGAKSAASRKPSSGPGVVGAAPGSDKPSGRGKGAPDQKAKSTGAKDQIVLPGLVLVPEEVKFTVAMAFQRIKRQGWYMDLAEWALACREIKIRNRNSKNMYEAKKMLATDIATIDPEKAYEAFPPAPRFALLASKEDLRVMMIQGVRETLDIRDARLAARTAGAMDAAAPDTRTMDEKLEARGVVVDERVSGKKAPTLSRSRSKGKS
ncbi:hypothetical protein CYMTET_28319, partial [Cymbomonas tetramitiformis]